MADIKLFRISGSTVEELKGQSMALEKSLQTLIEKHLEVFLGVRFLETEYRTGKTHGGRIDTLGIDENGCPVIIEYKRSMNENVVSQGLYYLDWLLDHKAEFELLVLKNSASPSQIQSNGPAHALCVSLATLQSTTNMRYNRLIAASNCSGTSVSETSCYYLNWSRRRKGRTIRRQVTTSHKRKIRLLQSSLPRPAQT